MPISEKTWEQAVHSQTACNLSGLAQFLVRVLDELRANGINGTDALNTHALVRLVVAQMAHLAYGCFDCNVGNLWQRAYQLAEIETGRHPYHTGHWSQERRNASWRCRLAGVQRR